MKKVPSMATMVERNRAYGIGALPKAFDAWFTFAPSVPHCPILLAVYIINLLRPPTAPNSAGTAAMTATTNGSVIKTDGLLGSARNW